MIVAIDGPAASGKSTVAKAVARRLGLHYLDTGAMYRSVALKALRTGTPLDDEAALASLAEASRVAFAHAPGEPLPAAVILDGEDVTAAIRTPEVDAAVSAVARAPGVREAMVREQRRLGRSDDLVVEGRDIGTVVFPEAEVKVYLSAAPGERARRRHAEHAAAGHEAEARDVLERLEARDAADSSRAASPLAVAADAVRIDTTGAGVEQVVDRVVGLAQRARRR
ncbi:MAG: (d)CMP kinase [Coriobacteriia bacterium]|nr:(d)CMP kinase [Coriobacteriia bacterium]